METIHDFVTFLDDFAPRSLAAEWDNTGLLLGDAATPVDRVMTCLTVTPEIVAEAVSESVQLIVSHHPILFRGTKSLTAQHGEGELLWPLLRSGCAVYSPHTSFDNCIGGINDGLCRRLGLVHVTALRPREGPRSFKLAVFVPESDLAPVSDALFAAGAGRIGNYEQCSFRTSGTGTFFGHDNANPTIGQKGQRESVAELRLEVLVPEAKLDGVISALRAAHSYEEPAFDLFPMKSLSSSGEGRIGELSSPTTLESAAQLVKKVLNANTVQFIGDPDRRVHRVALACGAAGEYLHDARRRKADLFLTGEMRFHDCLAAQAANLGVILPGHYATERPGVEDLAAMLCERFPAARIWAGKSERDPLGMV